MKQVLTKVELCKQIKNDFENEEDYKLWKSGVDFRLTSEKECLVWGFFLIEDSPKTDQEKKNLCKLYIQKAKNFINPILSKHGYFLESPAYFGLQTDYGSFGYKMLVIEKANFDNWVKEVLLQEKKGL